MSVGRSILLLALAAPTAAPPASAQVTATPATRFVGSWHGSLETGAVTLRLSLTVARDSAGSLTGHFTSIDQGNAQIPATLVMQGDTLKASMPSVGGEFAGVVNVAGDTMAGVLRQGGGALPLRLVRGAPSAAAQRRPQEPQPPFPYRSSELEIASVGGVRLSGTLTLPDGRGPFPAVVLVSGSGPQDRDESLMGHKPFLVLADYLARRGIASLRYDDRGVGRSNGRFGGSTSADFADDAEAAVRVLRGTRGVIPGGVGIVGHSEGALVGQMVAARSPDVAFLVMLAGPGVRGDSLLLLQTRALLRAAGASPEAVERTARINRRIYAALTAGVDSAETMRRVHVAEAEYLATLPAAERPAAERALAAGHAGMFDPWTRYFLAFDPAPVLRRVRVPVLALNGTLDVQVAHAENLAGIAAALRAGGNRDHETVALPGLNHLLQTARSGAVTEYASIEETMSPVALDRVAGWIVRRFTPH